MVPTAPDPDNAGVGKLIFIVFLPTAQENNLHLQFGAAHGSKRCNSGSAKSRK